MSSLDWEAFAKQAKAVKGFELIGLLQGGGIKGKIKKSGYDIEVVPPHRTGYAATIAYKGDDEDNQSWEWYDAESLDEVLTVLGDPDLLY